MRTCLALLVMLLLVGAGDVMATSPRIKAAQHDTFGTLPDGMRRAEFARGRADTIWFGGLGDDGLAVEGATWDFDTDLHGDPFQGWTTIDQTVDIGIRYGRVTAADFVNDPYTPIFPGSVGQLWAGIHQEEADLRDFTTGMGYGDNMCQRGFTPEFAYNGEGVDISFLYFNHSEPNFDYTYVYLQCFDDGELIDEVLIDRMDGVSAGGDSIGAYNWENPVTYNGGVAGGSLPLETDAIKLEIRFYSDGGYSDEDGDWATPAGGLGVDDVEVSLGGSVAGFYDFEIDDEGWTFDICEGEGAYMGVVPEAIYSGWIAAVGLQCGCDVQGNALEFIDEENSPFDPPGHHAGQDEMARSNVVYRDAEYGAPAYNTTLLLYDHFAHLEYSAATMYRFGYQFYPYSSDVNPTPRWSPRRGQDTFFFISGDPICQSNGVRNLTTLDGQAGAPCPQDWDSLRICYEITCSCAFFGIPENVCLDPPFEGQTDGTPVVDNFRLGITGEADAPALAFDTNGGQFHDGFGQNFPTYLEPSDVGDANHTLDLGDHQLNNNDWNADTTIVAGPPVPPGSPDERWLCQLNFHVARKGARQDMVPGYSAWKARFASDPEDGFVTALLDSSEIYVAGQWMGWPNKFSSHFHEEDPGFNWAYVDLSQEQEVLPDGIWSPGTRIEYYYTSCWFDNWPNPQPEQIFRLPNNASWEFEILPNMQLNQATPDEYDVLWPCVLYVDAYNRGVEYFINPLLAQQGISYDKFDYLDASSNWHSAMARTFGGTKYNPGGYGNNGCTLDQLVGYRMILLNTGIFAGGSMDPLDFDLFEAWLDDTSLGTDYRKGFIFNGDQVGEILEERGLLFANNVLGIRVADAGESYRMYNNDWTPCVELVASAGNEFNVADPGVRLYGSGCPQTFNYNVLEQTGIAGTVGNLDFYNYTGNSQANEDYVSYAQVVREKIQAQVSNWKTIVDGYSLHHLSEIGCVPGEDCASDSTCVVSGAADVLGPAIEWILEDADPFDPWRYPYTNTDADEGETHLSGRVNHLYMSRPNPMTTRATIRFQLANTGRVDLVVYDVVGRLVKTLASGVMEAGESTLVWDGTDYDGNRVPGGVFWMQLSTDDGYASGKKMLVLR